MCVESERMGNLRCRLKADWLSDESRRGRLVGTCDGTLVLPLTNCCIRVNISTVGYLHYFLHFVVFSLPPKVPGFYCGHSQLA